MRKILTILAVESRQRMSHRHRYPAPRVRPAAFRSRKLPKGMALSPIRVVADSAQPDHACSVLRCTACFRCDREGRIAGGLGAVLGFDWWPIKVSPAVCPSFIALYNSLAAALAVWRWEALLLHALAHCG